MMDAKARQDCVKEIGLLKVSARRGPHGGGPRVPDNATFWARVGPGFRLLSPGEPSLLPRFTILPGIPEVMEEGKDRGFGGPGTWVQILMFLFTS